MNKANEQGVALLTMLLLVAVMSALAVGVLDDIRFSIRRTTNAAITGQARWYALGAETLARKQLERLAGRTPGDILGQWREFPIDGGLIWARLDDAGNCLNLNSVVEGAPGSWTRSETGLGQYRTLLGVLGVSQRQSLLLSEALADWVDTDSRRSTAGAEDDAYLSGPEPYRTGGDLLAEVSELRAIRGYDAKTYELIRPFVCALPTAALSPINVNTLEPERSVLLSVLTEGLLTPERARGVLAARPEGGWSSAETFWSQPLLAGAVPSDLALGQVGVRTHFFGLTAQVNFAGGEAVMTSLLEQPAAGPIRLRARRWTLDE